MNITRLYNTYRVAAFPWQPRANNWALTVICKTTCRLAPGQAIDLPEKDSLPLHEQDIYVSSPSQGLYAPSDMAPIKPRADILVVGNVYAPPGQTLSELSFGLRLGEWNKMLDAHGDRHWTSRQSLSAPLPFHKKPLSYALAAGGAQNPLGICPPDTRVPTFLPRNFGLLHYEQAIPSVGLGPIAPTWPGRKEKNMSGQTAWTPEDWRRNPFPDGLQIEFFNTAPKDQQVSLKSIGPGMSLELFYLHPQHERLSLLLPEMIPQVRVEQQGRSRAVSIPMFCDTLWIDTEKLILTMTFRGQGAIEHPDLITRVLIKGEKRAPLIPQGSLETRPMLDTAPEVNGAPGPAIPFAPSPRPSAYAVAGPKEPPSSPGELAGQTMIAPFRAVSKTAHPFESPAVQDAPMVDDEDILMDTPTPRPSALPTPPAPVEKPLASAMPPIPVSPPPPPAPIAPPAFAEPIIEQVSTVATSTEAISAVPKVGRVADLKRLRKLAQPGAMNALDASNEAAGQNANPKNPAPYSGPKEQTPALFMNTPQANTPIRILWNEPSLGDRLKRESPWKEALDELIQQAGPELSAGKQVKLLPKLLQKSRPLLQEEIRPALSAAVDEDGSFSAPVVLLDGQLEMIFDDYETLKATLSALTPLGLQEPKLKELMAQIEPMMSKSELRSAGKLLRSLSQQLMATVQGKKDIASMVDAQRTQILIEGQHYRKRTILGKPHLHLHFHFAGQKEAWPLYLDPAAAKDLPLMSALKMRGLCELWAGLNQFDSAPYAFRALALAQVLERF